MDWNICSLEGRGGRGGGWLKCDVAREKKLSEKKEKKTAQAGLRVTNFERLHIRIRKVFMTLSSAFFFCNGI